MARAVKLTVNGTAHEVTTDPERALLHVLRETLDLTGAKYGCGEGQCGACTVLLGDQAVRSCLLPVAAAEGQAITTIEGLAPEGRLHPLQEAFLEMQAMQCGYCTPGMIMSACGLLRAKPAPSSAEIVRGMNGNICRCGTYARIVQAIGKSAQKMAGGAR
jgi:aerobic-type carbon monoxide dehydrogenase small subunit (CoxS/CutS family)